MDLVGAYERPLTTNHFSMRATSLLASFALLLHTATAQDCVVQPIHEAATNWRWSSIDVVKTGGVIGTLTRNGFQPELYVHRMSASGALMWKTLLDPTDPEIELHDPKVVALTDGGALVHGRTDVKRRQGTVNMSYANHYVIRLTPGGDVAWSRYYMNHHSVADYNSLRGACVEMPDGDLVLVTPSYTGLHVSRLTSEGIPVWTRAYGTDPTGDFPAMAYGIVHGPSDGMTAVGTLGGSPCVLHLDPAGEVIWGGKLDLEGEAYAVATTATADVVVSAFLGNDPLFSSTGTGLFRFTSNGTPSWAVASSGYAPNSIVELANGDLFLGANWTQGARISSSGQFLAGWTGSSQTQVDGSSAIWPTQATADTLVVGVYDHVVRAPHYGNTSCAFGPSAITMTSVPFPSFISIGSSDTSSIKTWTMSLSRPPSMDKVDMAVDLAGTVARPGFPTSAVLGVTNTSMVANGQTTVTLTFNPQMAFMFGIPSPAQLNGNTVTWNVAPGLGFHQRRSFMATFQVPASVPLGTQLTYVATATQDSVELTLTNNTATWTRAVTGSYDPNDKLVHPEGIYHIENDSLLDYTIRFQNTGTDTAFTVVVVDTLAASLDVSTFKPGAASHPYTYTLTGGGLLTFTFANILLPDSNVNEARSHGLVKFSIKPHAPIEMGQAFVNRAYIYFDFNEPIITPDAVTVVGLPMRVAEVEREEQPHLYPVPAKQAVTVVLPQGAQAVRAWLLSPDGRRSAVTADFQGDRTVVSVAHLAAGVHFLQLVDRAGRVHVARFVKE